MDADILCIALGNPKQEWFIDANRDRLRTPVMIGVGGTLDMLVGDKRRAPAWVQRAGLEWVVRASQEPGRLGRRYAHDARVFFPRLLEYLRVVRAQSDKASLGTVVVDGDVLVGPVPGRGSDASAWGSAARALASGSTLVSDPGARSLDLSTSAMADLIGLIRVARRQERSDARSLSDLALWAGEAARRLNLEPYLDTSAGGPPA